MNTIELMTRQACSVSSARPWGVATGHAAARPSAFAVPAIGSGAGVVGLRDAAVTPAVPRPPRRETC